MHSRVWEIEVNREWARICEAGKRDEGNGDAGVIRLATFQAAMRYG
jgi:hypothetical protein